MPYGRSVLTLACAATAVLVLSPPAAAQTVVKIGNISSYSGFVAQAADQAQKAIDLYLTENEKELPQGVKIEFIRRDDTSNPEVGKRLAQELITREHVQLLTGVILSPVAAAIAPLTAEAKVPLLISIAAGGSAIPRISPYVARVSFTLWQQGYPIGKWAAEQAGRRAIPRSATSSPGTIPKLRSARVLPMAAGRSSARYAFRRTIPISRRYSASGTPGQTSCSFGYRAPRRRHW